MEPLIQVVAVVVQAREIQILHHKAVMAALGL
jgi:hypothetical protein